MELLPVLPFEPIGTDGFPHGKQWIAQVKWDGVRMLTYSDGKETRLYNRRRHERTHHYPEITALAAYCRAVSIILDGEVIAFGPDGKPSFYEVMRRDGIRRTEKVAQVSKQVPITYMIFDLLYLNGRWVTDLPLSERQQLLADVITPTPQVQLVENFHDLAGLYQAVETQGMEGIMLKDLTSRYLINGKDGRWRKKKVYRDLIAVVGGVTLRDGIVNALLLGLFDQKGRFWYIGHAGTGKLSRQDWRQLTEQIQPWTVPQSPFVNQPPRAKGTVWLQPKLTVKIAYAEWAQGHSLRQPSIQGFVEVPPEQCVWEETQTEPPDT